MNILLLTEHWAPKVGGVERYLTNLTSKLKENHDIRVIAPSGGETDATLEKVTTRKRFFIPLLKPKWILLYYQIAHLAKKGEIDILLCGKGLFEGLLGYYLKKKHGIPYVIFTYAMEISVWKQKSKTYKKLQKALVYADRVVYINTKTRTVLEELGVEPERLLKIYPGVEDQFFTSHPKAEALTKYGLTQPYIVSISRLIPRKGLDDLIAAYAKLDQTTFGEVQLVIIGDGPERENLERHAEQLFVEPVFLTNVPDKDLPQILQHARLFALTPKEVDKDTEGFGIVYLEAAACGLATIGTKHGGVPEAVIHGETGLLVEEGNVEEIHEALVRLLGDTQWAEKLGNTGKLRAKKSFTWQRQAAILQTHLESITN